MAMRNTEFLGVLGERVETDLGGERSLNGDSIQPQRFRRFFLN